jgi:hypothetical protein
MDSLVAVQSIKGEQVGSIEGRRLITHIRSLLNEEWHIQVHHVYREVNRVADTLAKFI